MNSKDATKLRSLAAGWKLRAIALESCNVSFGASCLRECAEEVEAFLEQREPNRTSWFAHEQADAASRLEGNNDASQRLEDKEGRR